MPWIPLSLASTAATQARINETFGLDAQTFRASAFLGQGDGSFAQATPAKQHELFSRLLGLDVYERLCERARQDRRAARADLDRLQAGLAEAREQLAGLPDAGQACLRSDQDFHEATQRLAVAQVAAEEADAKLQEAQEQTRAVDRARQALALAESEHRALAQVKAAADTARFEVVVAGETLADLTARADALPAAEAEEERLRSEVEAHRRAVAAHEALCREQGAAADRVADLDRRAEAFSAEGANLDAKAEALRELDHHETCDRCGQALEDDARVRAIESYVSDAMTFAQRADVLREESRAIVIPTVGEPPSVDENALRNAVSTAHYNLSDARGAVTELAALNERLAGLRATIAKAEGAEYRQALAAAQTDVERAKSAYVLSDAPTAETTNSLQHAALEAKAAATQAQHTLDQAREQKAHDTARLQHLQAVQQRVNEAAPKEQTLLERIDVLAAAEQAHGRNGIPALILENRVGDIEARATETLANGIGDTAGARVEIRTQRLKADGDTKDELQVVLVTADGYDRPFDSFSGGEQLWIGIALREALLGGNLDFFVLDEPAFLDEQGKADLVALIETLEARGATILIVSHEDALRDALPNVIEIRKVDGRSLVIEGGETDA